MIALRDERQLSSWGGVERERVILVVAVLGIAVGVVLG